MPCIAKPPEDDLPPEDGPADSVPKNLTDIGDTPKGSGYDP